MRDDYCGTSVNNIGEDIKMIFPILGLAGGAMVGGL